MICGRLAAWLAVVALRDVAADRVVTHDPEELNSTIEGQWRLVGTKGVALNETLIDRIRGRWILQEVEIYSDEACTSRISSDKSVSASLAALKTTLSGEDPWLPEPRIFDGDKYSKFWSTCYRSRGCRPWVGWKQDPALAVKCVKLMQSNNDDYLAAEIQLQRWVPESTTTWFPQLDDQPIPSGDDNSSMIFLRDSYSVDEPDESETFSGYWQVEETWSTGGVGSGDRWLLLKSGRTDAEGAAPRTGGLRAGVWLLLLGAAAARGPARRDVR